MAARIRIGTRGSKLALAQAAEVRRRLGEAHPALRAGDAVETVVIRTTGDRLTEASLAEHGGKGLFTSEIEEALISGRIDVAVHSYKDVPTIRPDGIARGAVLPREDPRDALVGHGLSGLASLAEGALVGTSSLRRTAFLLHRRPDLRIVPFRGNVDTRLAKLARGEVAATLLACAGLHRLGVTDAPATPLAPEEMLPAPCQGIVVVERRDGDEAMAALLAPLNAAATESAANAERALLEGLDGSCRTPIAALAEPGSDGLHLRATILRTDGSEAVAGERRGATADATRLGADLAAELRSRVGPGFFSEDGTWEGSA